MVGQYWRRRANYRCARSFAWSGNGRLRPCPRRRRGKESRGGVSRRMEGDRLANYRAGRCQDATGVRIQGRRHGGSDRAEHRAMLLYGRRGGLVRVWATVYVRKGTLYRRERYQGNPPESVGGESTPALGRWTGRSQCRNHWGVLGMRAQPKRRFALFLASRRARKCRTHAERSGSGILGLPRHLFSFPRSAGALGGTNLANSSSSVTSIDL